MKYIQLIILVFIPLIFCICRSNNSYNGNNEIGAENSQRFNRHLKKISNKEYSIDLSYFCDRFYYSSRNSSSPTDYYIELPKLTGGLFFQYSKSGNKFNPFPILKYLEPNKLNLRLAGIPIKEAYIYDDFIVIQSATEEQFIQIFFSSPLIFDTIKSPSNDYKIKYTFHENIFQNNLNNGTWGVRLLQKRNKNHNSYSKWTTLLRGIISAGIVYINSEPFIAGETIYCPFSFSLISEELLFYKDTNEFNDFINKTNAPDKISILSFGYYEDLNKMIEGKEKIIFYEVSYPLR
jgi:hypothetical protein